MADYQQLHNHLDNQSFRNHHLDKTDEQSFISQGVKQSSVV